LNIEGEWKFVKLFMVVLLLLSQAGHARCRVSNRASRSFIVESGNVSNQRIGAQYINVSIADGKIIGKSDDGKTIGGSCKDGDELVINEENGVCLLEMKGFP
jgi:hypothetical protein